MTSAVVSQLTYGRLPHRTMSLYPQRAAWIGLTDCQARCSFCTSSDLSLHFERLPQASKTASTWYHARREMTAGDLVDRAARNGATVMYWSFSEPMVRLDFLADAARLAQSRGLATIIDTNGLSTPADIERVAPHVAGVYLGIKGSLRPDFLVTRMRIDAGAAETIKQAIVAWRDSGCELVVSDVIEPPCWQPDDALAIETIEACYSWLAYTLGPGAVLDIRPMFRPATMPPERLLPRNPTIADVESFDRRLDLARRIALDYRLMPGDDYTRLWPAGGPR